MTFNPLVPLATDSPSIFPGQAQANFSRLKALLEADHQFNNTAAANDGYHTLIHLIPQAPAGALPGFGRAYVKTSGSRIELFYMDETGVEYQITPTLPIRASVSFDGTGAVGFQTLRSFYNVLTVDKTGTGLYTVNFTTVMPNANYITVITGMRNGVGEVFGFIQGAAAVGTSQTNALVKIGFQSSGGSNRDVLVGNVTVFSVT